MLDDLLVHDRTKAQLHHFLKYPSHGLILTGEKGLGKRTLAMAIAAGILGLNKPELLEKYPYCTIIDPNDASITIEQIRGVQGLLSLKTPKNGTRNIRRVIIIVDAERMRGEAQNAFLKSLEEPPADSCIILTAEATARLLPTIYSRVQRVEVLPVGESAARSYFLERGVNSSDFTNSYALSQGQPGLLSALLRNSEHELRVWVKTAKSLLAMTSAERLLKTDELAKDKLSIKLLLNALQRIAHAALINAGKADKADTVKRFTGSMSQIQQTIHDLDRNANTKLLLDDMFLNL